MRIQNRAIVVTGASSGLGWATAGHLAARGARVWAVARSEEPLQRLAERHPSIIPVVADVSSSDDRLRLAALATEADVLVNNAGVAWLGPFEKMEAPDVRTMYEVNVLGLIELTRLFLPAMLERKQGHIVNISSVAAWAALPPFTVYSSTKFAVQGFTEGLRRETLGRGVTVASINPGPLPTGFFLRATLPDISYRSGETTVGPGSGLVALAVARTIRYRHVPGYQVVTVPRVLGTSRLVGAPVIGRAFDLVGLGMRQWGHVLRTDR